MNIATQTNTKKPKIKLDFKDSKYATGRRKKSIAKVLVKKGTGKIYVNGRTMEAINYYDAWLKDSQKSIFAGDFNNSIIWDKTSNPSFSNINNELNRLGYESSYHKQTQDQFGKEEETTFYHTKKEDKKYHIDYIYIKNMNINSLSIGSYDKWIEHSDHCPVSIEV